MRNAERTSVHHASAPRSLNSRGASIIAAIFIIVILGFMGLMFVTMIGTGSLTAVNDLQAAQALSVAEGGLEYAIKNGTYCTYSYASTPIGTGGSFTVSSQVSSGTTGAAINNIADPVDVQLTASPAGFATPGAITIDSELFLCSGKDIATNRLTSCKRAWAGSSVAAHLSGASVTQCAVMSIGGVGNAQRAMRVTVTTGGISTFAEPFPAGSIPLDTNPGNRCSVVPALSWCFQYTNAQGVSRYDVDNAPGSSGGSLEAVSNAVANARLTGYRQRVLPSTISAGTQVNASLWYQKARGHAQTQRIDMALVLVATDGTAYQLWSNTQISNIGWTQEAAPLFTVPAGKTINRIRLSFDIHNRASGGGSGNPSYVWFDHVLLDLPGGALLVSWQEVIN